MRPLLFLPVLLAAAGWQSAAADDWPRVRATQASFGIDSSAERILIVLPIYNHDNEEEYRVVCIGGSTEYTDRLSAETGQNFVGGLTCHLLDWPGVYTEYSLLAEDSSPAWHTRGRFSYGHLLGDCGDYPEYGRIRHFRLRGFELTLAVEDVIASDELPWIDYFVLNISVREDRSIRSGRTEQPGYLRPGADCGNVRKGYETLTCRDSETMTWGRCPHITPASVRDRRG